MPPTRSKSEDVASRAGADRAGRPDYQAARCLSGRTRRSFRSTRHSNPRRAAWRTPRTRWSRLSTGRRAVASVDDKRVKTALDETRLLILGAQILFGFHLNAAFQRGFGELSALSKDLYVGSFAVMAVAIGLLIAPSLQHRLVEQGRASARLLRVTTRFASMALLLFLSSRTASVQQPGWSSASASACWP
jgi:uncharacterized protein DUF6328